MGTLVSSGKGKVSCIFFCIGKTGVSVIYVGYQWIRKRKINLEQN